MKDITKQLSAVKYIRRLPLASHYFMLNETTMIEIFVTFLLITIILL